jgi:2-haloacid dehalogenase
VTEPEITPVVVDTVVADTVVADTVVFDIGGVLLDWNPRYLYRQLISDEAEMERFLATICGPAWHRAHDLGEDTEESCRKLAERYPEYAELIMAWSRRGEEMIAGTLDGTEAVLAELAGAGVRCFALSNMEPDKFALRQGRYPFFGLLEGWVISGLEGVVKPDRKIFEILLSRYELEPRRTVFVDDQPANVAAAAELGLAAVRFTTPAQLRYELQALGLPVTSPRRRQTS